MTSLASHIELTLIEHSQLGSSPVLRSLHAYCTFPISPPCAVFYMETRAEKKNRLSRLLGKREKGVEQPTVPPDSAYASSETPSGEAPRDMSHSTPDMVPVEKNSEMANIDQDRNLAVNPSTGEVHDQDTGELITVVTTTTTTTTTTTKKPGKKPDVHKDITKEVHESTPTAALPNSGPSEMPANTTIRDTSVPNRISSRPTRDSPPIPSRSPARKSGEFANRQSQASAYPAYDDHLAPPTGAYFGGGTGDTPPASPSKHNFSYPARNRNSMEPDGPSGGWSTTDQPQHHNKSTMNDLRAAAKGIHVCPFSAPFRLRRSHHTNNFNL